MKYYVSEDNWVYGKENRKDKVKVYVGIQNL